MTLSASQAGLDWIDGSGPQSHYPPFRQMLDRAWGRAEGGLYLHTHVAPFSGKVHSLSRSGRTIVDGAQSAGTCLHGDLVAGSDALVFPLHKHLGLSIGLAVAAVREIADLPSCFGDNLSLLEASTHGLHLYRHALDRIDGQGGAICNKARLNISADHRHVLKQHGLQIIGDNGHAFACVSTIRAAPISTVLHGGAWKHIDGASDVARFSFHMGGRLDQPGVDVTALFMERVLAAIAGVGR